MADDNAALVKAAEDFLAAAKSFNGDPIARMSLTRQADNLRLQAEDGMGTIMRQWDQVSGLPDVLISLLTDTHAGPSHDGVEHPHGHRHSREDPIRRHRNVQRPRRSCRSGRVCRSYVLHIGLR